MLKHINGLILAFGLSIAAPLLAADNTDRPPVADKVVAYSGEQGVKVWTLRIGERAENQALVQIEGIDNDWDKKIQKMKVEKTSKDTRYSTTVDGKPYVVLIVDNSWGQLYVPGESRETQVAYDESLSEEGNAQWFLTDYLKQADK